MPPGPAACTRWSCSTAPRASRREPAGVVGIVIVSHSARLAEGVVELARQMGGEQLALEPAGGMDDGAIGTDMAVVMAAIERARSPDGVLVLMDLGSALMSAEMAVEMVDPDGGPVMLSEAPLIEGAVAAATLAGAGAALEEVAAEARGALRAKAAQLGGAGGGGEDGGEPDGGGADGAASAEAAGGEGRAEEHELRLRIEPAAGLHARPAARLGAPPRGGGAAGAPAKITPRAGPEAAGSHVGLQLLAARQGDEVLVRASGPEAEGALDAIRALAAENFGDPVEAAGGPARDEAAGTTAAAGRPAGDEAAGTTGAAGDGAAGTAAAGDDAGTASGDGSARVAAAG